MKKYNTKIRWIAFAAAATMSAGILTGCGAAAVPPESEPVSSAVQEQPVSSQEEILSSTAPVVNKDDWRLVLVNGTHKIDGTFQPNCEILPSGATVDARIYDDAMAMIEACNATGCSLSVSSAYRDYQWQTALFQAEMQEHLDAGLSETEARAKAKTEVAEPGTSEHQTGLAMDMVVEGTWDLVESFKDTPEGKWLKENSWKYGFILRYPQGKEEITGVIFEPWHFRYVGKEAAKEITERGLCLEEYLGEAEQSLQNIDDGGQETVRTDAELEIE